MICEVKIVLQMKCDKSKEFGKRGETVLLELWLCTILPRSSNVTNLTEQITLAWLCTRNIFGRQKSMRKGYVLK